MPASRRIATLLADASFAHASLARESRRHRARPGRAGKMTPRLPLAADELQVWCLRPEALPPDGEAPLDAEERAELGRLVFARDRQLWRAAHVLLRQALAAVTGRPPGEWRFARAAQGKPMLAPGLQGPAFNLTHTPGLVACALCGSGAVGIDAEHDRDGRAPLEIAGSVFTAAERALLERQADPQRAASFFGFWTLKEAVVKATGQGLALDPAGLRASLDPPAVTGQPGGDWGFARLQPTPRHHLAVALRGAPGVRRLRWCEARAADWNGDWRELPLNRLAAP